MRQAIVVTESRLKPANFRWLLEGLERLGIEPVVMPAVDDDVKDPGKKLVRTSDLQERLGGADKAAVLLVGNVPLEIVTGSRGIKQKRGRPVRQGKHIYVPTMPPGTALYDARSIPLLEQDLRLFADVCKTGKVPKEEALDWTIVDTPEKVDRMLRDLNGTVSFDIETNGLYPWQVPKYNPDPKVISIGFGTRNHQWCIPVKHRESTWSADEIADIIARIDRKLKSCFIVAHNGKFDATWMAVHYGVDWRPAFDTMLAHYMLDENDRHGLKYLAQLYFNAPNYDAEIDEKHGDGPIYRHCEYLAHDVYYTRKLRFKLGEMLEQDPGVEKCFERILMPIASLFVDIELQGVLVDHERFDEAEEYLTREIEASVKEIRETLAKHGIDFDRYHMDRRGRWAPLNLNSPQQLAKLFFEDLGIKVLDRTEGGRPSTNESVLLRIQHPVAKALLKYRGADQNMKMFINGWKPFLVEHEDGFRLHPSFKLYGTVTGRASCEHPNLQQVPRDTLIRSLIGAALGWELIEIDLSQIEMRIAAELSGDPTLIGLFDRDEDVHWMTAIREIGRGGGFAEEIVETVRKYTGKVVPYADALDALYKMGPDRAAELWKGWKELRKKAKAVNFGYLFGMWWKKFKIYARDNYGIEVTDRQAQESRENFFQLYSKLAPWHEKQRRFARRNGYVRSLTGGKRRLPDAQLNRDCMERGEALRQAINSPVQRFACELNFMTLIQLVAEFGLDVVRPVGTVHDATLMECRADYVERVFTRGLEIMTGPKMLEEFGIKLRVPIKGDGKIGPWSKGVDLKKWKEQRAAA